MKKFYAVFALLLLCAFVQPATSLCASGAENTDFPATLIAAEQGDPKAMLDLGNMYEHGQGVDRNFGKAYEWYKKAADKGLPSGTYNVGVCHQIGMGVPTDLTAAFNFFKKSADQGLPIGMAMTSEMYLQGMGTAKDMEKGKAYLMKAADANHPGACQAMGDVYLSGLLGVKPDSGKALDMYENASRYGDLESMKKLSAIFRDGKGGVRQNHVKALKWALIAQEYAPDDATLPGEVETLEKKLSRADAPKAQAEADTWLKTRRVLTQ